MRNALIFAVGVLWLAPAALHATPSSKDDFFFPWTIGSSWVYKTTNKKSTDVFPLEVKTTGAWTEDGESGIIVVQKDKHGTMRQFMLRNEKGVFLEKLGLSKSYTPEIFTRFHPALPVVVYPLEQGNKVHWEGRLKVATINEQIIFDGEVVGWEDLDVPAGHFHCIKLHYHE